MSVDSHPVLTSTKGAVLILEAAAAEGIPTPSVIGTLGRIVDIQVRTPEDVQEWATWQEGPHGTVTTYPATSTPDAVMHEYAGVMFDQPFKVYAVTYDAATRFPVADLVDAWPGHVDVPTNGVPF